MLDLKLSKEEFHRICDEVEREHGPYCYYCGKPVAMKERLLIHRWKDVDIMAAAKKEIPAGADPKKRGELYREALRRIQLNIANLRVVHRERSCKGVRMVEEKVRVKDPADIASDTRDLANELGMKDSTIMVVTDMLDKYPNPEEMPEEELRQLGAAWTSLKVLEWVEMGIALGEAFKCHRCVEGECCTDSVVEVRPNEIEPMAAYLHMTPEMFMKKFTFLSQGKPFLSAPCPFYRRGKKDSRFPSCQVYPVRPLVCRLFPMTGFYIVRNIERCPMAADIASGLATVDTKTVELTPLEKRIEPYIQRIIGEIKMTSEEVSDELEKLMGERIPEEAKKKVGGTTRYQLRAKPLAFRTLIFSLQNKGKNEISSKT